MYKSHWSIPYLISRTVRAPSSEGHFILHYIQYNFSRWLWWCPVLFILHCTIDFKTSFQMMIDFLQLCAQCSQCCMERSIIIHHKIQNLFGKKYDFTEQDQSKNANTVPKYTNAQSTPIFSQPSWWTGKYRHNRD